MAPTICLSAVLAVALCIGRGYAVDLQTALDAEEFGIGFDLTPSYATAAISFANGTKSPLARVDCDAAWRDFMKDISWEAPGEPRGRLPRRSRVYTLSHMLVALVSASEERLGQRITSAAPSLCGRNHSSGKGTPVADLVREAFSSAGLGLVEPVSFSVMGEPLLYPESSILAAHGFGICQPYTSPYGCELDQHLPRQTYYLVGYYAHGLDIVATAEVISAYGPYSYPYIDFSLGSEMKSENPGEIFYWEEVRKALSLPFINRPRTTVDKVLIYGDQSGDEKFRQIIQEVLKNFLKNAPEWVDDGVNPVFAVAFGAAELALRAPYRARGRETNDDSKFDL